MATTKKMNKEVRMSAEKARARIEKMLLARQQYINDVENTHIKLQRGNSKTGKNCFTVSLLPIVDCGNCAVCKNDCYDMRNDLWRPAVMNDRARNSAVHKCDLGRYWKEISTQIQTNFVQELRINVGGDLGYDDFPYVIQLAKENPKTDILFFTKNYDDVNTFIERKGGSFRSVFPENVKVIFSAWENVELNNPYNIPTSHVLYPDGRTTAPQGSFYCKGNCSACHWWGEGCWALKEGESVVFMYH